jgi:epoxide hydrolase 4
VSGGLAYYRWMGRQMLASARRGESRRQRKVMAPTLILWGTRDAALSVQLADPGPELVPDRRVELIDSAGHFVHADVPERVNRALLDFLAQPQ